MPVPPVNLFLPATQTGPTDPLQGAANPTALAATTGTNQPVQVSFSAQLGQILAQLGPLGLGAGLLQPLGTTGTLGTGGTGLDLGTLINLALLSTLSQQTTTAGTNGQLSALETDLLITQALGGSTDPLAGLFTPLILSSLTSTGQAGTTNITAAIGQVFADIGQVFTQLGGLGLTTTLLQPLTTTGTTATGTMGLDLNTLFNLTLLPTLAAELPGLGNLLGATTLATTTGALAGAFTTTTQTVAAAVGQTAAAAATQTAEVLAQAAPAPAAAAPTQAPAPAPPAVGTPFDLALLDSLGLRPFSLQRQVQQLLAGARRPAPTTAAPAPAPAPQTAVAGAGAGVNPFAQVPANVLGIDPRLNPIVFSASVLAQAFQVGNGTGTPP
jgi:hypothetical protein